MTPEYKPGSPEEMEARITALLLGELPEAEAAEVRAAVKRDPELSRLCQRLKATIELVQQATAPAEPTAAPAAHLQLSDTRRQQVLQHFKTVTPVEFAASRREKSWSILIPLAALLMFLFAVALFLPALGRAKNKGQLALLSFASDHDSAAPAATLADSFAIVPQSQSVSRGGLAQQAPAAEPTQPQTWGMQAEVAKRNVEKEGQGAQVHSLNVVGYVNIELPAKPAAPAVTTTLSVEDAARKDSLDRRLGEVASAVDGLAEKEVLRERLAETDTKARFLARETSGAAAPTTPPVVAGGQAVATPSTPSTAPAQQPTPTVGGFGGGGMGGGGGGGGFGGVAGRGRTDGTQAGAWFGAAKQEKAADKLGAIAQNVDRNSVAASETEMFARRYGIRPSVQSAPAATPAPASPAGPAGGRSTAGTGGKPGVYVVPDPGPGSISPEFAGRPTTTVPERKPDSGSLSAGNVSLTGINTLGQKKNLGTTLRGFYDDNGIAKGVAAGDEVKSGLAVEGKASAITGEVMTWGDYNNDQPAKTRVELWNNAAAGAVNGRAAGIAGAVVVENKPAEDNSLFSNRGDLANQKVPILGDVPAIGQLYRQEIEGAEALRRSGGEATKGQDHYFADYSIAQNERFGVVTNAVVTDGESSVALGFEFSKKLAEESRDESRKKTEALGKDLAKAKASKAVLDELALQKVDPTTGLPAQVAPGQDQTHTFADATKIAETQEKLARLQTQPAGNEPDSPQAKPAVPPPVPQPEVTTAVNPFSTFSLNVADVSFRLAEATLNQGQMPDPGSIRSEEFINAFDYRDPEPAPGMPVAFMYDRTRSPFAHNRDLLRFSIKTAAAGRQQGCPLNLVLLLDNSGSMERADRVSILREALRVLSDQLRPEDKISLITFSRTARLWAAGVPGNQAGSIRERVSQLTPEGGTNLEEAMNLAYQTAVQQYLAGGINRVVLLTDGAANLGNVNPDQLKAKVESHRKQGIALDCFGIGWEGYNDDLLEILARNGDGRYGFLNTPEETASEFAGKLAGALHVAASDVKVQVEFNPARVTSYRQVGYAKHQLTKEQFRDNTVDAAEIGAAESGNALYVVETNPQGAGPVATVRVRFKVPGTADYKEHEWMVPYTGNAISLEQANPAMRLTSTAAAFSEWLAGNPYAGEVNPDRLLNLLRGVNEVYGPDARPQKLEWMIRQAKSISGK